MPGPEQTFLETCQKTLDEWIEDSRSAQILEYELLDSLKVVSAERDGPIVLLYPKVLPKHLNLMRRAHGGILAIWVDVCTSFVGWVATKENYVSVNININYVNAAEADDCLIFDCRADKIGRSLAFVRCRITNQAASQTMAQSKL